MKLLRALLAAIARVVARARRAVETTLGLREGDKQDEAETKWSSAADESWESGNFNPEERRRARGRFAGMGRKGF